MKILKSILLLAIASTFTGCINSDEYSAPDTAGICNDLTPTKQVSDINALATGTYVKYTGDDVIEAYVTSSDQGGNFYKSISLTSVDGTKGFSMPIDAYNIYTAFEPGRKVFVRLKDLYIVKENSATVLGGLYNNDTPADPSDDEVGRIGGLQYKKIIQRGCSKVNEDEIVKHLTISQAKNDAYLNQLIEFDAAEFTAASNGKTYYDASLNDLGSATNHLITDASGSTIILRASMYATFAKVLTPTGNGKIRGVLTKFGSDYQFMIRTLNDVHATGDRLHIFYEETFSSNFPIWTKYSVTGAQVWTLDTTHGNPGACARISGFVSPNNLANEDWLISPAIDLTELTSGTFTFDTATRFAGNPLEVLISTNYSGSGNPTTATWTPVVGTLSPSTGNFVWTGSGAININAFAGQRIYIAFKYTSTTLASATWEVDNPKIIGN